LLDFRGCFADFSEIRAFLGCGDEAGAWTEGRRLLVCSPALREVELAPPLGIGGVEVVVVVVLLLGGMSGEPAGLALAESGERRRWACNA
jgi:hypothetical protein